MTDLLKSLFGKKKQLADLAAAVTDRLTREWQEQKVAEASRLSFSDEQKRDASATLRSMEEPRPVRPLDDPDFIGAEAALKRASAKAIARDRAAGLEPVVSNPTDLPKEP